LIGHTLTGLIDVVFHYIFERQVRDKARIGNMNELKKSRPCQFAGSWRMDDKEAEEIKKELRQSWKQSQKSNV